MIERFIKIRNNNLLELYSRLTHSDFKGHYEDTYVITLLGAILALDMTCGCNNISYTKQEIYDLSIEICRIYETDDHYPSIYSIDNWTRALLDYMDNNNLNYIDIHKTSTVVLRKAVSEYLERSDI